MTNIPIQVAIVCAENGQCRDKDNNTLRCICPGCGVIKALRNELSEKSRLLAEARKLVEWHVTKCHEGACEQIAKANCERDSALKREAEAIYKTHVDALSILDLIATARIAQEREAEALARVERLREDAQEVVDVKANGLWFGDEFEDAFGQAIGKLVISLSSPFPAVTAWLEGVKREERERTLDECAEKCGDSCPAIPSVRTTPISVNDMLNKAKEAGEERP